MTSSDHDAVADEADERRAQLADSWERASRGWGRQADQIRDFGMPAAAWLIDQLELAPGQRLLELAAGPGDTGFLAAERIAPGGLLISSDGSEGMLAVARERAAAQGLEEVEFVQLQLEWIDRPTADVDRIVCRWGVMLCLDPDACLQECRRVLKPGGRVALAVWDLAAANPWAAIPQGALIALGHAESPAPGGAGMFALAAPGDLARRLQAAGFIEPVVETVALTRSYDSVDGWLDETHDCSMIFASVWRRLDGDERAALVAEVTARAAPFTAPDGSLTVPGSTLVAVADA